MKKVGKKTKKPNCGAVLIIRTRQPIAVFGLSQAIVTPANIEPRLLLSISPGAEGRALPGSPVSATTPPAITIASANQKVRY